MFFTQLAIAAWFAPLVRTETDYPPVGRSLGPWLVIFSVFAT